MVTARKAAERKAKAAEERVVDVRQKADNEPEWEATRARLQAERVQAEAKTAQLATERGAAEEQAKEMEEAASAAAQLVSDVGVVAGQGKEA